MKTLASSRTRLTWPAYVSHPPTKRSWPRPLIYRTPLRLTAALQVRKKLMILIFYLFNQYFDTPPDAGISSCLQHFSLPTSNIFLDCLLIFFLWFPLFNSSLLSFVSSFSIYFFFLFYLSFFWLTYQRHSTLQPSWSRTLLTAQFSSRHMLHPLTPHRPQLSAFVGSSAAGQGQVGSNLSHSLPRLQLGWEETQLSW